MRELFVADLSELLETERQMLDELPLMAARASLAALRQLFDDLYRDSQRHAHRLTAVFAQLDERARLTTGPGIRGLIEESRARQASLEPGELLDAALVGAALRFEHYEIASYETTRGYATRLGLDEAKRALSDTLEEERRAEGRLARLCDPPDTSRAA
jgi:ferritin-like metal-binding protein YciE